MERPILFSGPMIRALLSGAKTQTRRIIKPRPVGYPWFWEGDEIDPFPQWFDGYERGREPCGAATAEVNKPMRCPFGQPGDRLWVRETWRPVIERWSSYIEYAAGGPDLANSDRDRMTGLSKVALRFPGARADIHSEAWHPSIHMPRWASRINLAITGIKVERVQDISEADILADGVRVPANAGGEPLLRLTGKHPPREFLKDPLACTVSDLLRAEWASLWCEINGRESWDANPWVWAISFKVVQPGRGLP